MEKSAAPCKTQRKLGNPRNRQEHTQKRRDQKAPRGHSSIQPTQIYMPAGYEEVYEALESLRAKGLPLTEEMIQQRLEQLEEEEDTALLSTAVQEKKTGPPVARKTI